MKLTDEQQAIIARRPTQTIKVSAFAGCAKTSTLERYARAWPMPSLYLAFNRSIADEARGRFPPCCETRTAHSFAYRALDIRRRGNVVPKLRQEHLRPYEQHLDGVAGMTDGQVRTAVIRTIENFAMDAGAVFKPEHCTAKTEGQRLEIRRMAAAVTGEMLRFEEHQHAITHDLYLKRFELYHRIEGPYKYLLLDESQDLSPVLISIVEKANLPTVVVGDPWQSIYRFRGAVDAMDAFNAPELPLTQSWRFGPEIARIANYVLRHSSRPPRAKIKGNPARETTVSRYTGRVRPGRGTAILARTNARLFDSLVNIDRAFHLVGGLADLTRQLLSAHALWKGRLGDVLDPGVQRFSSWRALDHAAEIGDGEARRLRDIIQKHGDRLPSLLERLKGHHKDDEAEAELVVSTAHRSKGREWDVVYVLDDFENPSEFVKRRQTDPNKTEEMDQEVNLLYVALSRAVRELHLAPDLFAALA